MALLPYQYINRNGIPTIKSTGVTVNGTTSVDFIFKDDTSFGGPFRGLLLVYFAQAIPAGTTATLPIRLVSSVGEKIVTTYNDANYTVADFKGTGVYLFYYDRVTNTLQILSAPDLTA